MTAGTGAGGYVRYVEGLSLDGFDPAEHDEVYNEHLEGVIARLRSSKSGSGYLDTFGRRLRHFFVALPGRAEVLAVLLYICALSVPLLAIGGPPPEPLRWISLSTLFAVFGSTALSFSVGLFDWQRWFQPVKRRADMRTVREFNHDAIEAQIGQARERALARAKRTPADEGPDNLLRLVLLSRMHWDLVYQIRNQFKIFRFVHINDALSDEQWKIRLRLALALVLLFAAAISIPVLSDQGPEGWPALGLLPVATGAVVAGLAARWLVFAFFLGRVRTMRDAWAVLFRPEITAEELRELGIDAPREGQLSWDDRTETSDLFDYTSWLRDTIDDLDKRARPAVLGQMMRRAEESEKRPVD